jgi:beta-galactosidase
VIPFYAGALHYWRVPPAKWATYLRGLHASGFTLVETSEPWRVHEPEAGEALWSGDNDLAKFLETARAAGLSVVLRVGPSLDPTLTSFGLPDWVLAEPTCQAKTVHGTPAWMPLPPRAFPIPSYASKQFRAHVHKWYAAIAKVVKPFLGETVVAIGIDNQTQHFFRTGAFDLDYHPDALEWWREHSGLEAPPREWSEANAAPCALWLKHQDEYIARSLGELSKMLDEVGFAGIARFHNVAPVGYSDVRALQSRIAGPVAIDSYRAKTDLAALRRRASSVQGSSELANSEPGSRERANSGPALARPIGFIPWLPPIERSQRDEVMSLLAAGCRGFVADHDASWQKTLIAALIEVDWPSLRREKLIALVDVRADARFGILTNLIDPVTPALAEALRLGPGGAAELGTDEAAIAARKWQTAIMRALELAQIPYAIVDEATPEEELARYRAVIAPTPGHRIDRGLFSRLRALAEHKKAIVVIGPSTPTRDELDQPLGEPMPKRLGKLKEGSLEDLVGLGEDLAGLAGDTGDAWLVERPDSVRTYAYGNRVVFVVSDAERATTAVILAGEGATSLRDPFGDRLRVDGGRVTVPMPPCSVRMLLVE